MSRHFFQEEEELQGATCQGNTMTAPVGWHAAHGRALSKGTKTRDRKALMRKRMMLAKDGGALSGVSGCLRTVAEKGFLKRLQMTMFYDPRKCLRVK